MLCKCHVLPIIQTYCIFQNCYHLHIQDVVDSVLEGEYLFCTSYALIIVTLSFFKFAHVTLGFPLVFSVYWMIGLFVLHSLDPNKGVVFRGRTRGLDS